jgi:hypothetical protein
MQPKTDGRAAACLFWVRGRNSHSEQIWSELPQIADIYFSCEDFSVGPKAEVAALIRSPRPTSRMNSQLLP